MTGPQLTMALSRYPHTAELTDATTVTPSGLRIVPEVVRPIVAAYRRQVRDLEFDICEVAISTYLVAREHGVPLVALPIFPNRRFHHHDVLCREGSGITGPKDLEGRRVGVRAYSVTSGVWVRGVLQHQFGIDLDRVTWVVDDEEHVRGLRLPESVRQAPDGSSLAQMFHSGEIDAALSGWAGIGRRGQAGSGWTAPAEVAIPAAHELLPVGDRLEREWYGQSGWYPIHGVVVVKQSTLSRHPQLAPELIDLFAGAKRRLTDALPDLAADDPEVLRYRGLTEIVGPDPLPYGLAANRPSLDAIVNLCHEQGLTARPADLADIFVS
ncbi:ABC transporter substrate-binding protein [Streptomyces olivaceus]